MNRYTAKRINQRIKEERRRKKTAKKVQIILFCTICVISAASVFGAYSSASASKYRSTFVLTVSSGDTLWDIAKENNPLNKDVRRIIDDIIRLNKLTSSDLCAGDKLIIPVY